MLWSSPQGHHDRYTLGLDIACLEFAQQLSAVQVAPNEDQSAHALLLFPPRLPNALSTRAKAEQHVYALKEVPTGQMHYIGYRTTLLPGAVRRWKEQRP